MIVINEEFNKIINKGTYIALGSFDGIHLGHLTLIKKAVELSRENNSYSMVYTFKNHPLSFINEKLVPSLLMDNKNKIEILKSFNIDISCFINFNREFMNLSPRQFIEMLLKNYNMKGIIIGFNYRFGHKNLGNVDLLKKFSEEYGFSLTVMDAFEYNGEVVSSTRIRESLSKGKIKEANYMLSRPYNLTGKVVKGRQLGRTIGFPTANIEIDPNYLIPKIGVYYTNVEFNGQIFKGITSVGHNPTVNGKKLTIETYILNFDKSIYDCELKVYFLDRIRDEIKFNSLESLKEQLNKDKNVAKERKIMINI